MAKQKLFAAVFVIGVISLLFYSFKNDEKQYMKTELYFGLSRNDSGVVTQDEWLAFEDTVIATLFPYGSTIFESNGKWMNESGVIISERSKLVTLINELTPELSAKIDTLRERYKRYHHQTSVMRVDQRVEVSF
jgi:hypothetical protein